tara:strand:+ start:14705 stop:14896 length:192 start_codon:yes stop_codon:yes gene_type:complete
MNQEMIKLKNGVKKYLKDLGLDMSKYVGCAKTDTKIIAVIDKTIIHISHDLTRHSVKMIGRND